LETPSNPLNSVDVTEASWYPPNSLRTVRTWSRAQLFVDRQFSHAVHRSNYGRPVKSTAVQNGNSVVQAIDTTTESSGDRELLDSLGQTALLAHIERLSRERLEWLPAYNT
jgi:hypothetical protein